MPDGDGDCFKVAFRLITGEFAADPTARLVHGVPLGTGGKAEGIRYWHALVECDQVIEMEDLARGVLAITLRVAVDESSGKRITMPAALYRYVGTVELTHEYRPGEAIFEALKSGHYGPWVDDVDLLRDDDV